MNAPKRASTGRAAAPGPDRRTRTGSRTSPTPRSSLADIAYERVKLGIITLRYRPGAYVNEAQLCDELELGRTPVHHAITRLAHEHMVEIVPRKGIIISPVSWPEIMANVEARLIIEPQSAALAAERGSDEDFAAMRVLLESADKLIGRRDVMGLMNIDRQFHSRLAQASRNTVLEGILRQLHEQSLRFWFISLSDPEHLANVDQEHWTVLEALEARDRTRAEQALRAHVESFRNHIRGSV